MDSAHSVRCVPIIWQGALEFQECRQELLHLRGQGRELQTALEQEARPALRALRPSDRLRPDNVAHDRDSLVLERQANLAGAPRAKDGRVLHPRPTQAQVQDVDVVARRDLISDRLLESQSAISALSVGRRRHGETLPKGVAPCQQETLPPPPGLATSRTQAGSLRARNRTRKFSLD